VYNRPDHLRKTLDALNNNRDVCNAKLVIYSDGPREEQDETKVRKVRELIRKKNKFSDTEIIESKRNMGLAKSVIDGVSEVLGKYCEVITLEDDVLTSPGWYQFMNHGIQFYRYKPKIWSMGGYCPPIKFPYSYSRDVFLSPLATSYSWGTWEDRWRLVDWEVSDFDKFIADRKRVNRFCGWNPSRMRLLKRTIRKNHSSWAIRWEYAAAKHSCLNVLPTKSHVTNIGYDVGEHSQSIATKKANAKYSVVPVDQPYEFQEDLQLEPAIIAALSRFYHVPESARALHFARRLLGRLGITC